MASLEADMRHQKAVDAIHAVHAAAVRPSPESTTDRLADVIDFTLRRFAEEPDAAS